MTFLQCVRNGLSKYLGNMYFFLSAVITAIAFCCSVGYTDVSSGTDYTILRLASFFSRETLLDTGVTWHKALSVTPTEFLTMVVPLLVSVPFAITISLEQTTKYANFGIVRVGFSRYYTSTAIAAIVSGGCVLLLGWSIYCLWVTIFFSPVSISAIWELCVLYSKKGAGLFLYGCGSTFLSLGLSAITENCYIVVCVPFVANYLWKTVIEWLGAKIFGIFYNPLQIMNAEYLQGILFGSKTAYWCFGFHLATGVLVLAGYIFWCRRRAAHGQ